MVGRVDFVDGLWNPIHVTDFVQSRTVKICVRQPVVGIARGDPSHSRLPREIDKVAAPCGASGSAKPWHIDFLKFENAGVRADFLDVETTCEEGGGEVGFGLVQNHSFQQFSGLVIGLHVHLCLRERNFVLWRQRPHGFELPQRLRCLFVLVDHQVAPRKQPQGRRVFRPFFDKPGQILNGFLIAKRLIGPFSLQKEGLCATSRQQSDDSNGGESTVEEEGWHAQNLKNISVSGFSLRLHPGRVQS